MNTHTSKERLYAWSVRLLRTVGLVAPFVWIYLQIDFANMQRVLQSVAGWVLVPTLVLPLVPMTLQGIRWWVLMRTAIPSLTWQSTLECHFAASFYGLVLPGASAQEVVRAFILSRQVDYSVVWGATWVSKLLGLIGWMVVGVLGVVVGDGHTDVNQEGLRPLLLCMTIALVLALIASFNKGITRPIRLILERMVPPKMLGVMSAVRNAIYVFKAEHMALFYATVLTVALQFTLVMGTAIVLYAISGVFLFWPIAVILALIEVVVVILPLTPGGIGIREGMMALLFARVGVGTEEVGVYIALSFLGNLARLTGGIPVALGRVSAPARKEGDR